MTATIDDPALTLRTKTCVRCRETKTWGEFFAHVRWDDGTVRRPRSLCKVCDRERRRLNQRRVRAEIAKDPDQLEAYKQRQREYNATYRRRAGKAYRSGGELPTPVELLPSAPLAAAIVQVAAEEAQGDHGHDRRLITVCERAGVSDRTMRFWRSGVRTEVEFAVADRALLALDLLWWEVWPPEQFPDVAELFEPEAVAA